MSNSNVAYPSQLVNTTPVSYAVFNSPVANAILKNSAEMSMHDQVSRLQNENQALQRRLQVKSTENNRLHQKIGKVEDELESCKALLSQINTQMINNGQPPLQSINLALQGNGKGKANRKPKPKKSNHSSATCQCCCVDKPYICEWESCGKRFRQKPHLEAHRNIHIGRRFVCEWPGCGKSFVRKYNLQEHQKLHSPTNPNLCTFPDCGKVFSSKYSLMRHQNAQHNLNFYYFILYTLFVSEYVLMSNVNDLVPFETRARLQLTYFLSQLFALLTRLSPIVQSISALLILVFLIQFSGDVVVDFFALTPGEIISPGQWYHTVISLWSHVFLETRIYSLVVDLLILSFCSTLIEPLWGPKEVLRFIVIACIPSALLTAIHFILLYCITYDVSYLFNVRIHGFLPFCAAVVVTVKQLLPQSVIFSTSFGRLKNDHIPFTVFVILVILYICNILRGVQVIMFTYGIITSWFYLRFLQPHTRHTISTLSSSSGSAPATTTTITRGDFSDSFAFETFFPNVIRPIVAIISTSIYNCLVRCHLCPKIPSPAVRLLDEQSSKLGASSTRSSFKYYPASSVYYNNRTTESNQPLLNSSSVENLV
ncbi:hypothetical protein BLOT_002289 [Blomia tropicalis]|nr:hypothetical protein BLOT_002289 [Blomia tropicalis]